jgi:hypothetical protein
MEKLGLFIPTSEIPSAPGRMRKGCMAWIIRDTENGGFKATV